MSLAVSFVLRAWGRRRVFPSPPAAGFPVLGVNDDE